jgi:large subunit ribosomal protein L4e
MKATLYTVKGEKKADIQLPELFDSAIREDIAAKYFEADKLANKHPYSHAPEAGKRHSASGTISHRRHEWKGHYGKGISRAPRKVMWRRGTQFFWVGAEVSGARGGRRVHGPSLAERYRKVNKKEIKLALSTCFASTAHKDKVLGRYSSLKDKKISINFPIVIESKLDNVKAKEMLLLLNKIFHEIPGLIFRNKEVRAGRGKTRGRKYKSNAGLLLVKAKDEKIKFPGIEVKSVDEINVADVYPLGRLTAYTEKALKELEAKK